jgi:hypothetical protein
VKATDEFLPIAMPETGQYLGLRTTDGGEPEPSLLVTVNEGQPLDPREDLVQLVPQEGSPTYTVRTVLKGRRPNHKGPAQVATPTYRRNFDRVFGQQKDLPN